MNKIIYYFLMIISGLITASSQILLKKSASKKYQHMFFEYLNPYVIVSYIFYVGVLVLNVFIYTGIDYRFGVVINSLAMVFVMILSKLILKERITKGRVVGNALIVLGIICFTTLNYEIK
jgi:eamA-like transporter family